jgi:phage shock protein PspC (stress-responsive transcriptional regulator)
MPTGIQSPIRIPITKCNFCVGNQKKLCNLHGFFYVCIVKDFRNIVEWKLFGICAQLGERLNISISRIRMWFIYISFLTFGSPIIIYFIIAFWVNIKKYILSARRNPIRWF